MRVKYEYLLIFFCLGVINAFANSAAFYHQTPQGVIKGEEASFEVMLTPNNPGLYDVYLYYRQLGENDYRSILMERSGYLYQIRIPTGDFTAGALEYYIGYEGELGEIGSMPESSPQINPYVMRIAPNSGSRQTNQVEILILSPERDEMVRFDELLISASILGIEENFDFSNSKLLIDGTNVTGMAEFREGVLIFSPQQIRGGIHNIEIIVQDRANNLLGREEWSFRATGGQDTRPASGSYLRGSAFIENRYTKISESGQNYFRTGAMVNGSYNALDYNARLIFSSEEENNRQPVNRYAAQLVYNFTDRNNILLRGGDFTPYYNPLAFHNKRVRGIEAGLAFGFFTFDFVYGQLYRGIEGTFDTSAVAIINTNPNTGVEDTSTVIDTLIGLGKYEENIMAFRPGFRFGDNVHWNLNLVNSREKENSIKYGGAVKEALVVGTDLSMNFDSRRILFDASFQASINNNDAGLPEITYDSLAKVNEDLADNDAARSYWDFLEGTGMIKMTPGLNPYPSLGMQFETALRYFGNNLVARYTNVQRNFASPGNPYLLKDISGIYLADNLRLLDNQVFLNLFFRSFATNRSQGSQKTSNNELGLNVSYFPAQNLPSLTVSFINMNRANDVTMDDSVTLGPSVEFYMEDNQTQTITLATSYNFDVSTTRNTVTLNFSNYTRDEAIELRKDNQSEFTVFGAGVVTYFNFPLITRLNYSQSGSVFGVDRINPVTQLPQTKSTTDIKRFLIGLEYKLTGLINPGDLLRPFANFNLQDIEFTGGEKTTRNNYTMGLSYRDSKIGILSIRYDHISYGTAVEYNDAILNAKYQYNF